jgi:prevent-host-death family protein
VKELEVLDLGEDTRDLIREAEIQGAQTTFVRNGKPVAVLISHDEYVALRETIDIANDAELFAKLAAADQEEIEARGVYQWLRFAKSVPWIFDAAFRTIELDPIAGAPLFEPLKGLWSYQSRGLRIIYKIAAEARMVVILSITSSR